MKIKELEEIQLKIKKLYNSAAGVCSRLSEMKEYNVGTQEEYDKMEDKIKGFEAEIEQLENIEI